MTAIVFDLDGTLIDSVPDIHAAVARLLAEEGRAALTLPQVKSFVGNGVSVLIARVLAAVGEPEDPARHTAWLARFMQQYHAASSALTTVYPGVRPALSVLQAAGHPMGLCTNKPKALARDILRAFGLDGYFQVVIGGDSLPQRKPDPEPLRVALRALGVSRAGSDGALFVGDSEVDAETAEAAAVPLLLYTEGYRRSPVSALPHLVAFDDFAALPGIVALLAAAGELP